MSQLPNSIASVVINDFAQWRNVARKLIGSNIAPEAISLIPPSDQELLFAAQPVESLAGPSKAVFRVPEAFIEIAESVACHRDHQRWNMLYLALWRLTHDEPHLLQLATDNLVHRLHRMRKAVDRDCHKMKAFVRFRKLVDDQGKDHFVAWHRPDHLIVERVAPFFSRRFKGMNWSILSPDASAHWDGHNLRFEAGVPRSAAPDADELEQLWKGYYRAVFNPARIKIDTMKREMPVRHWQTLPETDLIDELLQEAPQRVTQMIAITEGLSKSAADYLPARTTSLKTLANAAKDCKGCELCKEATQTVFGIGTKGGLMIVGEQPGDEEDQQGVPFVGPAGRLLNAIMEEAGVARDSVYVTNAVKHFSFERIGKRRLHKKPLVRQIIACKPWLEAEIHAVRPRVILCLGATAVQSLLGRHQRLSDIRGQALAFDGDRIAIATWHPAAILRSREPLMTQRRKELTDDLHFAHEQLQISK